MSETQTANVAEQTAAIVANFDKFNDAKDFKFRFKKDKLGNQRANVEIKGLVPSVEGIIAILEAGGKELELLQDAMYDYVRDFIGGAVGDDEKFSQEVYNADPTKFLWKAIANAPKEDRRASSIPEDSWKAFAAEYIEIMPALTGKSVEAVTNATTVYLKKFAQVKTDKTILKKLQEQLALFIDNTKNGEAHTEILELLVKKVEVYLSANDIELLKANL